MNNGILPNEDTNIMQDETEQYRRARISELNSGLTADEIARRAELEAQYGQVWNTDEVRQDFKVIGFMAPYVVVERKSDRKKGSLEFCHSPRYYFGWQEDSR